MGSGPTAPGLGAEQVLGSAEALHRAGDLRRAEHLYREALRLAPRHPRALGMLGVIGCQSGNLDAGVALLREAWELAPDDAELANNLGRALLAQGDARAARAPLEAAVRLRPGFAEAHLNLGNALIAEQRGAAAEQHYRQALRAQPGYVEAQNNLGKLLLDGGRAADALPVLQALTTAAPAHAQGHLLYARALLACARAEDGAVAARHALNLDDGLVAGWEILAACQRTAGDLAAAAESLARAVSHAPDSAPLHERLGLVHFTLGDSVAASRAFARAVELAPEAPLPAVHLGMAHAALGARAAARAAYERALALDATQGEALRALAEMPDAEQPADALLARVDGALGAAGLSSRTRGDLLFARGRLLDRRGDYPAAFAAFAEANALRRAAVPYDRAAQAAFVSAVIETFAEEFLRRAAPLALASERPVFVIGMPRAGTSLVEQILASHPEVHGAGELTFFPERVPALTRRAGQGATFPRGMGRRLDALAPLGPAYLDVLAARAGAARRVVDKMPYNFLYLGVIGALFPRARVIHVRRHAVATCHSIFTRDLAGSHPYSYDLPSLGEAWLGYARLMNHWRERLSMPWCEVEYETLVADLEGEARRMVEFLDLSWDPACLRFHESPRAVATASQWQVRRPLYGEAREHWRHYASQLEPLLATLRAGGWRGEA